MLVIGFICQFMHLHNIPRIVFAPKQHDNSWNIHFLSLSIIQICANVWHVKNPSPKMSIAYMFEISAFHIDAIYVLPVLRYMLFAWLLLYVMNYVNGNVQNKCILSKTKYHVRCLKKKINDCENICHVSCWFYFYWGCKIE